MVYYPLREDELVMVTPNTARYQALLRRGAWGRELLGEPTIAREQGSGTDRTLQRYMARMGYDPGICTLWRGWTIRRPLSAW